MNLNLEIGLIIPRLEVSQRTPTIPLKIFMFFILSTFGSFGHATIFSFNDGLTAATGTSFSEACNKMGEYSHGKSEPYGTTGYITKTYTPVSKSECENKFNALCHASIVGPGSNNKQFDFIIGCHEEIKALQLQEIEPLACGASPKAAGNPIKLATGAKVQPEHIMFEGFSVEYQFDSSTSGINPWQQKPDEILRGDKIGTEDVSRAYSSKSEACISGLEEFKSRAPATSWIQGVTAEYTCACLLKKGGQTVAALAIVDNEAAGLSSNGVDVLQHKHSSGTKTNYYRDCASSQYKSFSPNVRDILQIDSSGLLQLTTQNGKKTFDTNGQLSATYNSAGQLKNRYGYNAQGDLISQHNEQGQQFNYNFTNGLLKTVQAPNGKILQFSYTGNLLTKVTHPDQTTRIYHYEDTRFPNALTGITDERGIRYATWKYDDQGRAISSEHAGGAEKTSIFFNADGTTTVTNALGKKTIYSFTDILGVRRVNNVTGEPTANCVGANQAYTYTPQGLVETKTDWNGSITKYAYDTFGRELTRTNAFGTADATIVQTCWNATQNTVSRIIEPTRVTLFDYSPAGQLKSQTVKPRPAGAVDCSTAL